MNQVLDQIALVRERIAVGRNFGEFPAGQDDIQPCDMVRSRTVHQGMGPAGIVSDHPADRRARTGSHIRSETKSVGMQKMV